ncbi:hypothetical protein Ga0466249_005194 [Sporomusaceae bacterium BoRhaA]|uniref:hypothetical protein n=1 Tax=Pelorhabdus rhamnosifermentans TaxID=2772457 RepID=UPI001C063E87|nr:hypothetical protein [Pelorhabdus rhamnosifermentans]MBU2704042.1 hypothetical protein [Pelorhabdus rhamnosifermentans]
MEKEVALVQPIGKPWPVRRVGPARLHKRRIYKPKLKNRLFSSQDEEDDEQDDRVMAESTSVLETTTKPARSAPEGVGKHIDLEV